MRNEESGDPELETFEPNMLRITLRTSRKILAVPA